MAGKARALLEHYRGLTAAGKICMIFVVGVVAAVAVPIALAALLALYHLVRLAWIAVLILRPW